MSSTVPEGWSLQPLAALANYHNGRAFKPDDWSREGLPIIRIAQINNRNADLDYYAGDDVSEKNKIRNGDLLFSWSATLTALIWDRGDAVLNQHIFKVEEKTGVNRSFLHQLILKSIEPLAEHSHGSTMKHIKKSVLDEYCVETPPLPEQQKIAAILSSFDDVIEKTRAQIDKLKDLKTGMMQELLAKGIGHTEFKESPVGRIPARWEVYRADDISDAIMVGVVIKPTQYYVDQGVPALRSANVRENGLTMHNLKYFSAESNDRLHKSKLREGDLLTVRTGYPGTTAVVTNEFEGCNCIDVVITRPSAEMDSDFFCLWVNSDHGKGQVLKAQGGLAQQHFNVGDMKNLLVPVPPLVEQRSIFRAVDSVIRKLSTSEKRLARFSSLKKALMQDLLTGKVRVNVDQKGSAVA